MNHVLIIEDDEGSALLLQLIFAKLNVFSSVLCDFESIMRLIKKGIFNAVTIDLAMPNINGIEYVEYIHLISPNLPIVIITGMPESIGKICLLKGASFYLHKPIDAVIISNVMKKLKITE
jgi:DNA-binding NtrC family response regulator